MAVPRETWSGRTGFVLAAVGSAVGLGSIWKFPYEVGANGGSAFVLFYVAGLVLVVVPRGCGREPLYVTRVADDATDLDRDQPPDPSGR